jgi:hypothetical protein
MGTAELVAVHPTMDNSLFVYPATKMTTMTTKGDGDGKKDAVGAALYAGALALFSQKFCRAT